MRRIPRALVSAILVLLPVVAAPVLCGSPVVWERMGDGERDFGVALALVDDLDGDGLGDLAVGAPEGIRTSGENSRVFLISARNGETIATWTTDVEDRRDFGGAVFTVGDIDRDGFRDLVVLSYTYFEVRSTLSGELLYRFERLSPEVPRSFWNFAESLGDIDTDGVPDFYQAQTIFTDEFASEGRVAAHSGATGEVIWDVRGGASCEDFGDASRVVGDLDDDGIPDLVVGRPFSPGRRDTELQGGELRLLSGQSGEVFASFSMAPEFRAFGAADIVLLGDTDGNGQVEVAVSAYEALLEGREGHGWVGVFELPEFRLRYGLFGADPDRLARFGEEFGIVTEAVGDVDLDGAVDFLASSNRTLRDSFLAPTAGRLFLYSGRTGALLQVYEGPQESPGSIYFAELAPLGDVDGDGRPEFAITTRRHPDDRGGRGVIQVLRYEPEKVAFYRGDANRDGRLDISDTVRVLRVLFGLEPLGSCPAAYDTRGDGDLDLIDAISIVVYLFERYGDPPAPPFGDCGRYARVGGFLDRPELGCEAFEGCP